MLAWWNLAFPPNNGVVKILALGDEVGEAYSRAIEAVLANPELSQWEYVLCLEHDNSPPSDGVIRLIDHMQNHPEFAWIGGLYFTKGFSMPRNDGSGNSVGGGVAQIWGDINDPITNYRPVPPRADGGLIECFGTGQGFTIFRLSMFKDERLSRPWFRTKRGLNGEGMGTQDLVFAGEARKHGYRCAVACDVKVGHYDLKGEFGPPDTMY
jgi:GT2 family glycosyltransferase